MNTLLSWAKTTFAKQIKNEASAFDYKGKLGETLSPNMRALRLTISITDVLFSMGVAASDVVSMGLDVVETYCRRKVQLDVSSTVIILSQDRGNDREPLTLVRAATARNTNNMTIQLIQELVRRIVREDLPIDEAEKQFDEILENPVRHNTLVTTVASGMISAGVAILYTGSPIIIASSLIIGASVAFILRILSRKRLPAFYLQVMASIVITLLAAGVTWLGNDGGVALFSGVNPTLIVIGGIIMLVAGLTIVGAVQDAIDEYYVTAGAKILKVIMMTIGIVTGVLIGLYLARIMSIDITVTPERMTLRQVSWQFIGAIIIAAGFALSNHSRLIGVTFAGILGGISWYVYLLFMAITLSPIAASGVAALVVGSLATILSRVWRVPSMAMIAAGVIPLVPGLTLYNGLMQIVNAQTQSWILNEGMSTLFTALLIALAVAAGASFGTIIGRPLRRTFVRYRNRLPRQKLTPN